MTQQQRKSIINFDPKINMGHILTIVVLLAAAVSWSSSVDRRIDNETHDLEIRDLEIDARVSQTVLILDNLTDRVEDLEESKENGDL